MPAFTIKERGKETKVLVCKSTIHDIVKSAVEKLHLLAEEYKLLLDNGAVLDEDDVLAELPPLTQLVIVPVHEELESNENILQVTPDIIVGQTPSSRNSTFNSTSSSTPRRPLLSLNARSFPWRVLEDVTEKLASGRIDSFIKKDIIHSLALYMSNRNDFSRGTCASLTKELIDKYSDAFQIRDADGDLLSDGRASFFNSLYERVNFIKPNGKKEKRKRRDLDIENEDPDSPSVKWPHISNDVLDSYGCVAWQPILPSTDSEGNLEAIRIQLMDVNTEREVLDLIEKSYWLQRHHINRRVGSIHSVLDNWPALKTPTPFQAHSSKLLGKDVRTMWANSSNRFLILFNFLSDYSIVTKQTSANKDLLTNLKKVRDEAEEAAQSMESRKPLVIAAFLMLIIYMKEDSNSILQLVDPGTNLDGVKSIAEVDRPLLIVRGRSLFDPDCESYVACEGEVLISTTKDILEGIKLHFLSFYNFNFHYPEKGKRYLEFIQRSIFKINPEEARRGAKDKRRMGLDPMVKKLITNLDKFYERTRNIHVVNRFANHLNKLRLLALQFLI
ncbi:60S ribosomal protein L7a-2 [Frankliniella fusca]|uniref:60S ribosomal protein L7a-2 n=1 Tax=Frankliniella fusca TaxID=407009 RepID=A0AAE1HY98_9NEOP|nr:60S ribosomal protein L7a-2 [Frankliniella fusca]